MLSENNDLGSPSQIFNCDEAGLPLEQTLSSVVAVKGQKHPRVLTSRNKKQIYSPNMFQCGRLYVLPPLVIFGRKTPNPDLIIGEVPGTMYGLSDNGWMDGEIFESWFTYHFLVHVHSSRPLLLLIDGHSTHYGPAFVRRAAQEKVTFGPLKTYWNQEFQKYIRKNPLKVVTQWQSSVRYGTVPRLFPI